MQLYTLMCEGIRAEELRRRPLADKTSCTVHIRACGESGKPEIVVGRYRIDRPEALSERIYHIDDLLE